MSKCVNCGEELLNGAKFCMYCGQRQPEESEIVPAAPEAAAQEAEMPESSRFFAAAALEETAKAAVVEETPAEVSAAEEKPAEAETAPETPAEPEIEEKPAAEPVRLTFDPPAAPSFATAPTATAVLEKPVLQEQKPESFVPQAVPAADPEKPGNKSKWQIMSTWGYIGAVLLMCVPVIGLIFAIVWACGGCRKYAKRNIARATLIFMAAGVLITVAAALVLRFVFPEVLVYAFEFFNPGYTIVF